MWESVLEVSSKLLSSLSGVGVAVLEFLENESLNQFLNGLVIGPSVSTFDILFGSAIGAVLLVGVYNWITNVVIPG